MAKPFSVAELWDYGHRVLALTRQIERQVADCERVKGDVEDPSYFQLSETIRLLHDLLSNPLDVPPEIVTPPPPMPWTDGEIPF
jgi:hypothetical protein